MHFYQGACTPRGANEKARGCGKTYYNIRYFIETFKVETFTLIKLLSTVPPDFATVLYRIA